LWLGPSRGLAALLKISDTAVDLDAPLVLEFPMASSLDELARRHWAFLLVFLLLGTIYFGTVRDGHDWGGDFSIYLLQARNFAEHRAFDQNSYVPTVESMNHHPAVYPPLPSLILAPVYAVAGLNYRAFKYTLILFLWFSLPLYYAIACRRGLNPLAAASIMLIFGLSPLVLAIKEMVGSDSVFLFVAGATLLFLDLLYQRQWDQRHSLPAAVMTAILLMLCYLSRITGLAIIGAFTIHEFWRARRPRLFGVTAILLTAVGMIVYTRIASQVSHQYNSQFPFQPRAYVDHAIFYLRTPAALWADAPDAVRYTLAMATLGLLLVGVIRQFRQPTVADLYVVLWMAVLVVYFSGNMRYVMPLIPFFLIYATLGLMYVLIQLPLPDRLPELVLAACGLVAVSATAFNLKAIETGAIAEGISQTSFVEVCSFLRQQTPADALILSWNPRVFALYTDKASALYPQTEHPGDFESQIPRRGPVFLVYYNRDLDRQKLTPYLRQAGSRLRLVFENMDFRVYALPPGG